MAKEYETTFAVPQRKIVRDAVIGQLAALTKDAGLYFEGIVPIAGILRSGNDDDVREEVARANGKTPVCFVATGRKLYKTSGDGAAGALFHGELQVHVYAVSRNVRSHMARTEGDAVSDADDTKDPGVEAMLEQIEDRLIGFALPSADGKVGIYRLVPVEEDELELGADFTAWRQVYQLDVARERRRNRPDAEPLVGMRIRHVLAEVDVQSELVGEVDSYDAGDLMVTLVDARPAAIVAEREISIVSDDGIAESAFVESVDGTHAFVLERAPTRAPVAGDLVYVSINPIITAETP